MTSATPIIDWTRYGHDQDCTGVHWITTTEYRCPQHPHVDRTRVTRGCHRRRSGVVSERIFADGSTATTTVTSSVPEDQPALIGEQNGPPLLLYPDDTVQEV